MRCQKRMQVIAFGFPNQFGLYPVSEVMFQFPLISLRQDCQLRAAFKSLRVEPLCAAPFTSTNFLAGETWVYRCNEMKQNKHYTAAFSAFSQIECTLHSLLFPVLSQHYLCSPKAAKQRNPNYFEPGVLKNFKSFCKLHFITSAKLCQTLRLKLQNIAFKIEIIVHINLKLCHLTWSRKTFLDLQHTTRNSC